MTDTKLYTHTRYIWHLLALNLVIRGPLVFIGFVADITSDVCEKLCRAYAKVIPLPYIQTKVEFDKLTPNEQRNVIKINRLHGSTEEK